jgi:hypothetical protein
VEICLIPPIAAVSTCDNRPYQMMIPDLSYDTGFKKKYEEYGLSHKYFVILDNGAYETTARDSNQLIEMAYRYRVDEVIAPDVMRDTRESLRLLDEFMAVWKHPSRRNRRPERVMAVLQGRTIEQCQSMARQVAADHPLIETIGIPKHLPHTTGIPTARLELALWLRDTFHGSWEIHFLGFTCDGEVHDAAEIGVRSLDSSIPYVCAGEKVELADCAKLGSYPPRQRWYANMWANTPTPYERIWRNIITLDEWATAGKRDWAKADS